MITGLCLMLTKILDRRPIHTILDNCAWRGGFLVWVGVK